MCLVVSAAAWVFRETLCEVTAGTWLLCFEWASFVAAENRGKKEKEKEHHYPAGFLVLLQLAFCFSSSCLPSPVINLVSLAQLERIWSMAAAFSGRFYWKELSSKYCLAENTCFSYSETQNILLLMTLGVCLPSVGGGEGREMGSSGKVVVPLSHKKVVSFHFRLTNVPSC